MKSQVLFLFVVIFMCEYCDGLESNTNNELQEALHNLAEATFGVWPDLKRLSIMENEVHNSSETGRGKKTKMAIPLMFGFKMAGIVISALTALKVFLLQSLILSKFALAGAVVLAIKVVFDHMNSQLYKVTDISHVNSYPHSYPSHLLGVESSQYETVADPGNIEYAYYNPSEDNSGGGLPNSFGTGTLHTAQEKNSSSRSAAERLYNTGAKRPNSKVVSVKTIIRKTTKAE
ncbi:uncharacterized protein LOC142330376 [Lycorma delicatula]|uniref:uncharacterized protein LOC142330376 n=1 Tax=Lycorma delicatula TaxID=130591 RepID=UPI003F515FB7